METPRTGVIYKITSPTGKIYIGKSVNLKARISFYKNLGVSIEKQRLIYASLKKYGWDAHSIEIICYAYADKLSELEIQFIKEYNSFHQNNLDGMNLTMGGEGFYGHKQSKEQIENNIKRHTGSKRSEETKKKMSDIKKGKRPSCLDLPRTEKQLYHLKYGNIGTKRSLEAIEKEKATKLKKFLDTYGAVLQYDKEGNLIKEWHMLITNIAKEINVDSSFFSKAIRRNSICKGFYWKYKYNNNNSSINNIEK